MDGILTHVDIERLIESGAVRGALPPAADQVQPTSLDLRLGTVAHRIRAGFLPRDERVADRLADLALYSLDLERGAVLERGHIYLVPLAEHLALPRNVGARCNPKSSTGRIDLFTRVITDAQDRFDDVREGYEGPLWLEIMPRSFPVRLRAGLRLNQIRFLRGRTALDDARHASIHAETPLVVGPNGRAVAAGDLRVDRGFHLAVSLRPRREDGVIGWRALRYTGVLDLERVGGHDPAEFFEPIVRRNGGRDELLLEPEEFYIFQSRERVRVPPNLAAEMHAYDVGIGELRTNYAGFFDAGFGHGERGERRGTPAVLEVRPHDVPFLIEHGQVLFRLEFHRTTRPATRVYGGKGSGSNYARQGLTLAKYFRGD